MVPTDKPLDRLLVLEFSQFLSGPSAALRLADLGARVIKIERPVTGDICRTLYISNVELDGDSTLFHAINRNKESFAADLKNPSDRMMIAELIGRADVLIENFRPGVMERLGFGYETVSRMNDRLVYGRITGYGACGPWESKPGQDLLVQSLSGLVWLNGRDERKPAPFGLAIADMMAGAQLAQGILACLAGRSVSGKGALVEVSLLEAIIDAQAAPLTARLNERESESGHERLETDGTYGLLYGVYPTADSYIAVMALDADELGSWLEGDDAQRRAGDPAGRDGPTCEQECAARLKTRTTGEWLERLEKLAPARLFCTEVLTWNRLMEQEAFSGLNMIQDVTRQSGVRLKTTRCPIRIDGQVYRSEQAAPKLGEHNAAIVRQFSLKE